MVVAVKPILRLVPAKAEPDPRYYEPCEKNNEIMRQQLEEIFDRMADLTHIPACECKLCFKYEMLANMLLLPIFT